MPRPVHPEDSATKPKKQSRYLERKAKKEAKDAAEKAAVEAATIELPAHRFLHASCAELRELAEPGSVDVILTDPTYPKQFLHTYTELAETASILLREGGLCVTMAGQSWLPEVMQRLGEHLGYWWMGCYYMPGTSTVQIFPRKVIPRWKPLLIYAKGAFDGAWFSDVATSKPEVESKNLHKWGQAEAGMIDLTRRFTTPGQLVCDPFMGSGTTAVCLSQGRRFLGCDIDPDHVETARSRYGRLR